MRERTILTDFIPIYEKLKILFPIPGSSQTIIYVLEETGIKNLHSLRSHVYYLRKKYRSIDLRIKRDKIIRVV